MIRNIYVGQCPNCEGSIDDERLLKGLVCRECLEEDIGEGNIETLIDELESRGSLKNLKRYSSVFRMLHEFSGFFMKALDSEPWSAQKTWALRIFLGKSFSIIAPTGVGKTVFGVLMALYLSSKGSKSYLIFPTTTLVLQVLDKLRVYSDKLGLSPRILYFHSKMTAKARRESMDALGKGEYDILVTTSRFMIKHAETIGKHRHAFVFADDVDAVLRSSRSIISVLRSIGFDEKDIRVGEDSLRIRRALASAAAKSENVEPLIRKLEKIQDRLEKRRRELKTVLVVSSATGRPRGPKVLLFREMLGFQAGGRPELLRNIVDAYMEWRKGFRDVLELVRMLGSGGIVYVPVDKGIDYAEELAVFLSDNGIRAEAFHSKNQASLDRFAEGEIDVLVGVAVYYGVLVRGIDLPWRIRYAVFAGVPRFKFSLRFENAHPVNVLRMLSILSESAPTDLRERARRMFLQLRRVAKALSPAAMQVIAQKIRDGKIEEGGVETLFARASDFIREALQRKDVRQALKESKEVVIKEEEGSTYIYIPDTMTYIQASGRTSRLFAGGLTKGVAVTLIDDQRLYDLLSQRLKWFVESYSPRHLTEIDVGSLLKEIDRDRDRVKAILEGRLKGKVKDLVKSVLVVVESPNKARTIAGFFGRPSIRIFEDNLRVYEVTTGDKMLIVAASGGHVVDLPSSVPEEAMRKYGFGEQLYGVMVEEGKRYIPVYNTIKKCQVCGYQFVDDTDKCPRCGSPLITDKKGVLKALRELSMETDRVLIGTDPDTEGEKIGWDLASLIRPFTRRVERIEFHEVTKRAIERAINAPRPFNAGLVEAQMVRRIEDRWIGYTISPHLWRDFWPSYCEKYLARSGKSKCGENRNLSAGRVQTPVLGWIIQRYEEYRRSERKILVVSFRVNGSLEQVSFLLEKKGGVKEASALKGSYLDVRILGEEKAELAPPPPYTTDTMLSDASRRLRLSADYTMRIAQDLFELGLITYHRTDSTRVSDTGINVAREYLSRLYGESFREYFVPRKWGEGGAHEAIRPTKPIDAATLARLIMEGEIELPRPLTRTHYRLYDLIFKRFIASQMVKAQIEKQKVRISLNGMTVEEERTVDRPLRPGFLEVYNTVEFKKRLREGRYPVEKAVITKRRTVPLYTQGDVVRLMKERGIGRPSTYATIISKLLQRRYVIERGRAGKLVPTRLGIEVYRYLRERYGDIVSEERTRILEEKMDKIMSGEQNYTDVLDELYKEIKAIL